MPQDEDLLLAVLNSAPVVDGVRTEQLVGEAGKELATRYGGTGTPGELAHLRSVREALQDLIRGRADATGELNSLLEKTVLVPEATPTGLDWELVAPPHRRLAVRVVMAWSLVEEEMPGRLRACANTRCNLFLIDRSRPGTAKWCSMAVCGNRMKARVHASRKRESGPSS
ncbi:putative RNA-binding Zn ribbon-like protein [Umezawaea tangerina]|uniref:Putative RNA-binding Zn ribbon-like protein n=2 Tax=Umezawaea tangerina TaxID=84725 RepID=A0A2T0T781_9PSEU|nr:putative RNA-binding Zn ribbon-like protein [Umezawaea tangerina]